MSCFSGGKSIDSVADIDGFYYVCNLDDVPENGGYDIKIRGKRIAIFKVRAEKTRVYALSGLCSHQGQPIFKGTIEEITTGSFCVICPTHNYEFSLDTGISKQNPTKYRQKVYPVRKKGDSEIWIKV
eukprot:TRINITY_DN1217_c2_g1_i2.p1 TRINITY_DN1217_c2_g1~~TRINITY_DN1217_c2_g1_i2.p1  ORF type:complete len:127 (+),score=53.12 TRINITY_DN1217_c2_g1_i2:64-444(+)